jgi:hypothetical protein
MITACGFANQSVLIREAATGEPLSVRNNFVPTDESPCRPTISRHDARSGTNGLFERTEK